MSHLQVCQDQDNDDCLGTGITKGVLIKVWENERNHLIAEIQALKDLLSQVTAIAAANRVQDPQNSSLSFSISKILQFVSALLSKEKECLLDHIRIGIDASSKSDVMDMEKLENAVSELVSN